MRAQHLAAAVGALAQIKRVLLLARGMLGRNVERSEVVKIVLDMRAFGDAEAHLAEDRHQLVDRLADGMDAAFRLGTHRQGDVDALAGETRGKRRVLKTPCGMADGGLDLVLEAVE